MSTTKTRENIAERLDQTQHRYDILGTDQEGCIHVQKNSDGKIVVVGEDGIDCQITYNEIPTQPWETTTHRWCRHVASKRGWLELQYVPLASKLGKAMEKR